MAKIINAPLLPSPGGSRFWISLVIVLIGVYGTITDLRYLLGAPAASSERWAVHIHCMISAGSGFLAAFFLFAVNRLMPMPGVWQLAAPLVTIGLGAVAITASTRSYLRDG